jgi:hypothetical protein
MKDFRRFKVREKSHALILNVYKITARFPREELYGLTSQLCRCSASMGANIAEGCGKEGNREFYRFFADRIRIRSANSRTISFLTRDLSSLAEADYGGLERNC